MHRPDHHGYRCVHGSELRLPDQPGQGPGTSLLHRRGRVGHGGVQVAIHVRHEGTTEAVSLRERPSVYYSGPTLTLTISEA